jgi:hypothetical protein
VLIQQEQGAAAVQLQLVQAESSPFFTDAQVSNLKKNLDDALTAITNTQPQIVQVQAAADAQVGKLDQTLLNQPTASWDALC